MDFSRLRLRSRDTTEERKQGDNPVTASVSVTYDTVIDLGQTPSAVVLLRGCQQKAVPLVARTHNTRLGEHCLLSFGGGVPAQPHLAGRTPAMADRRRGRNAVLRGQLTAKKVGLLRMPPTPPEKLKFGSLDGIDTLSTSYCVPKRPPTGFSPRQS
jgi:hypothetical protein